MGIFKICFGQFLAFSWEGGGGGLAEGDSWGKLLNILSIFVIELAELYF